jgi:hypothetical protein
MVSLLPFVLSLAFTFGGGTANTDLGYDTQRLDTTTISVQSDDADTPPPCTSLCKGPEEVF